MFTDDNLYYHYEQSLLALGDEVGEQISMAVGDRIKAIARNLSEHRKSTHRDLIYKKLIGEGPIATLKYKLGLAKGYSTNLLQRVPDTDRATREAITSIIQEFIVTEQTGLMEGGEYSFTIDNLRELPADVANLKAGVYRYRDHQRLLFVIQVIGVNYGFLIVSLPQKEGLSIVYRMVSYVEIEKEWVDHDYLEFCSLKSIRNGLLTELKKQGYSPPLVITQRQLITLLNTLEPETNKRFRNLVIAFQNYRVKAVYSEDAGYLVTVYHTSQLNYSLTPEENEINWNLLNATKQNQLYELFKQKVKELRAV